MMVNIRLILLLFLLFSCTTTKVAKDNYSFLDKEVSAEKDQASLINTSDTLNTILTKIDLYNQSALEKLNQKDTIGAEIYVSRALEIINDFDERQISILSQDSLFQKMSTSLLQLQNIVNLEKDSTYSDEDLIKNEMLALDDSLSLDTDPVFYIENNPIPYTTNRKVENVIKFFTTRGRNTFQKWLDRGSKYESLIKRILREENVPEDLYYLAMIESGFNTRARSWAAAVGPWQFIGATGKAYGLNYSYWVDDRKDMENSTRAAARHLKDLYKRFDDWYLAMAGYNCNPAKIARRVRQYNTKDYFKLKNIPRETRGYVPNFLAARIIGSDPEKYGFKINYSEPMEYERIYIKDVVDLNHIAVASGVEYSKIRELNPAIIKWLTPSDRDSMYINVPIGTGEKVLTHVNKLPDNEKQKIIRYKVRSGDAMSLISQRFGISMQQIRNMNKMRNNNLRAGQYLFIPVPASNYHSTQKKYGTKTVSKTKRSIKKPSSTKGKEKVIYIVKSGDSLGLIAEIYQTRAQNIRNWNGLSFRQAIRVGQELTLWVNKGQQPISLTSLNKLDESFNYHKVRSGDSLWDIAKKYNTSISDLKKLNKMSSNNIKVGSMIKVSAK